MAATTVDLKLSPEVRWYLDDRGYELPTCPPRIKTPEPSGEADAQFDPERVDRVMNSFKQLRHTQGRWGGRVLVPDPWQLAYIIAPIFGWVRWDDEGEDWVRVYRSAWLEMPRKNGKSTISGGIGLYLACADGEPGAQVVAAATTESQAGYVFNPLKTLAQKSPGIAPFVKAHAKRIIHPPSNSYIEVVSSVAEALHGGNIHGAIIDEVHLHKTPDLIEAIETGTGARAQPLIVMITTADDGRQDTIYARKRDYVEKVAAGVITAPTQYGAIWAAEIDDDPFAEETMRKANPGYGQSPTKAALRESANQAKQSPADLAAYMRLHLGLRTKQHTRFIELEVWDRNLSRVEEADLVGRQAYGGLDLAATTDLCALSWIFPDKEGGVDVLWRHWCPERAYDKLVDRTAGNARVWRTDGLLTVTPGDVADYDFIQEQILTDCEQFDVQAICYDRWNASQLVNDLLSEGAPMIQVGQGFATLSAPLKAINHLLLEGSLDRPRFRHGGNALMRWQVDNLAVAMDPSGNVKPDKRSSGDKIDGFAAAVDAMSEVILHLNKPAPPPPPPPRVVKLAPPRNDLMTIGF